MMSEWQPVAKDHYVPMQAGSVDGTDTEPHDRAVWRAMNSHYSPPDVDTKPDHTLFVGRLPHSVEEEQLHQKFSMFGVVEKIQLIRDVVTGFSKGYCFVEYRRKRDAEQAFRESTGLQIKGCPVLVDWEAGHRVKGWIPRRLGGGWGGRKEAGQLRFGCRDRPWKKPIVIKPSRPLPKEHVKDTGRPRNQNGQGSEDRHKREDRRHQHNQGTEEKYRREDSRHQDKQGTEERYRRGDRQGTEERYRKEDRQGTEERYRKEDGQGTEERYRKEDRQRTEERYRREDRQGAEDRYRKEDRQGTEERYRREDRQGAEERYRREDRQGTDERYRREHSRHQDWQESGDRQKRRREDYRSKEDIRRCEEKWERHRDKTTDRKRRHSSSPN